jgi:23S rRNA (guanosine2251-2'-O)-methyltransferase
MRNYSKKNSNLIFGKNVILEFFKNSPTNILELYISEKNFKLTQKFCQDHKIKFDFSLAKIKDNKFISSLLPADTVHQSFCAKIKSNQNNFLDEISFLDNLTKLENKPNIVILDQLTDPHNIGAIIRSCAAFGVQYVVFTEYGSPKDSPIILKSSAGTLGLLKIVVSKNLNNLIKDLKGIGYWCAGLAGEARENIQKISDFTPIVLVLGNEGKGIRPLIKKNCDILLKIPMTPEVESLNVSNAAAISLFLLSSSNMPKISEGLR